VSLVLVGGIVGLLLFNTSMQQSSFAATALEEQATNLAAREQTLQMELDELRNPQRVATQAQEMGMVVPAAPTFLTLGGGEVEGVRTPATPEDRLNLQPPAPVKPEILAPAPTIIEVPAAEVPPTDATTDSSTDASTDARTDARKKNRSRR
jgi:type II secretory pathway pseudopilin PulG